jgi:hypothetical protein
MNGDPVEVSPSEALSAGSRRYSVALTYRASVEETRCGSVVGVAVARVAGARHLSGAGGIAGSTRGPA